MCQLEDAMAKALEGKFFWAISNSVSDSYEQKAIRDVQKEFRAPPKIVAPPPKIPPKPIAVPKEKMRWKANDDEIIDYLRIAICLAYGVTERDLRRHTNDFLICSAKHHFYWALTEYLPHLSIAEIGRRIGKHHSSIINTKKKFDPNRKDLQPIISSIDSMMEKAKCGF